MATGVSPNSAVGIRKEETFASGGGIDSWQVVESVSIQRTNVHVYGDRVRSSPEQIGGRFSHQMVAGSVTFPVSPANPTQWWRCGIGGTGPYTPQIPLPSMLIEEQQGSIGAVATSGDMISRLELSSRQGDILRCTASIEGAGRGGRTASSIPSTAFPSGDDPYLHSEATFTLDGVANGAITAFSATKENNLITDLVANGRQRRDIPATKSVVTGSISILFEDTGMRNRFMNAKPSAITAEYIRGGRSFKIELVNLVYDSADEPIDGQASYINETLTFTAFVEDPTNQNSLKVTVV